MHIILNKKYVWYTYTGTPYLFLYEENRQVTASQLPVLMAIWKLCNMLLQEGMKPNPSCKKECSPQEGHFEKKRL